MKPAPSLRHLITTSKPPPGQPGDAILVFEDDGPVLYTWCSMRWGDNWYTNNSYEGTSAIGTSPVQWMWLSEAGPGSDVFRRVMDQVMAAVDEAGHTTAMFNPRTDTLEDLTTKVRTSVARLRLFLWGRELDTIAEAVPASTSSGSGPLVATVVVKDAPAAPALLALAPTLKPGQAMVFGLIDPERKDVLSTDALSAVVGGAREVVWTVRQENGQNIASTEGPAAYTLAGGSGFAADTELMFKVGDLMRERGFECLSVASHGKDGAGYRMTFVPRDLIPSAR